MLDGWFTDAACTRRYNFSTPLTGDLTLYAGWLRAWTVTFADGLGGQSVREVADGRTVSRTSSNVPRGYAFEGWYTGAARPYDFSRPVTGDLTLYGKWRPLEEVTVSYDCRDGSPAERVTYYMGETPVPPAAPALDGYAFQGWYTDPGLARPWTPGPLTGDLALYAGWRKEHTVSFDSQGGSPVEAVTRLHGEPLGSLPEPELKGYEFQGWSSGPNFIERVEGDLTLRAQWFP